MKKNIIALLVMVLGAVSAQAEETNFEYDNGYRWFINVHGNVRMSLNEHFDTFNFGKWLTPGANIQIGYNFNDYWGLFAAAGWNQNRVTYYTGRGVVNNGKFTSWEPSLNVMYNLTNGFAGYRPNRRHNLYMYAGFVLGISRDFPDALYLNNYYYTDKLSYGGRLGFQYIWSFSKWVGLSMYAEAQFMSDKFNAIDAEFPLDGAINAGIGLHFNISKNTHKVEKSYTDNLTIKHDTLYRRENRVTNERVSFRYATPEGSEGVSNSEVDNLKTMAAFLKNNPDRVAYVVKYGESESIVSKLVEYGVSRDQIIVHDSSKMADVSAANPDKNETKVFVVKDFRK